MFLLSLILSVSKCCYCSLSTISNSDIDVSEFNNHWNVINSNEKKNITDLTSTASWHLIPKKKLNNIKVNTNLRGESEHQLEGWKWTPTWWVKVNTNSRGESEHQLDGWKWTQTRGVKVNTNSRGESDWVLSAFLIKKQIKPLSIQPSNLSVFTEKVFAKYI